jgi:uncharacterized membrane protein
LIATFKSLRSRIGSINATLSRKLWKFEVAEYMILLMVVIYTVIFSYFTIMVHYSFRTFAWDLGIFTQSMASATKGQLFVNNVELYYTPTGSYFGIHFAPILFTIIPIFSLLPTAETLLIIQPMVLALGALPTYLIARRIFNSSLSAFFLSIIYLISPLLQSASWYDFHPQAFFPLLILSATYFLKERKAMPFLLFLVLTLMTIEQASYLLIVYLIYVVWEMKKEVKELIIERKITKHTILPFVALAIIIVWIIGSTYAINTLNPNPSRELKALDAYKILGINSITEIPIKAITNPDLLLKAVRFDLPSKLLYLFLTFAPSGFLAWVNPIASLPALLWLFMAMVSNYPPYYELGFQYTAFTLPFVTIATIEGLRTLTKLVDRKTMNKACTRICIIILIMSFGISVFASPLSFIHEPRAFEYFKDYGVSLPSSLDNKVRETLKIIPNGASVITTPTIFPHLANNLNAYVIPPKDSPSSRLFTENLEYLKSIEYEYVLFTDYWDVFQSNLLYNEFINGTNKYGIFVRGAGLEIYKLGYIDTPLNVALKLSCGELLLGDSVIVKDASSESGNVIMFKALPQADRTAWYGPYITLVPGDYTANFRLKIDNLVDGEAIKLDVYSGSLSTPEIESINIAAKDFTKPLAWQTFTLNFTITERTEDVEFRGLDVAINQTIWLDYVEIIPN